MSLTTIWHKAQADIREKIGQTSYETWFSNIEAHDEDAETLHIQAPDNFFKNWIAEHYQDTIKSALQLHGAPSPRIIFSVNNQLFTEDKKGQLSKFEERFSDNPPANAPVNSRYTFDNFIIGESNKAACAYSLAVAESPAKAYNPLFIYGSTGLGKTHLIRSICHKIRTLHPHSKIAYLTSEQFTNELIDSIRYNATSQFKKKYREMDVLLIDDIQFIAGRESTQLEFFHTFNHLHETRKQIIITSDKPPLEISGLEERIRSRFAWGLITEIKPPDYETRVAILKKKVENEPVEVPNEVIFFIAEHITNNIRELEGALIRVAAYSLLEDKPITLDLAKSILKDMIKSPTKIIAIDVIQKTVVDYFQLSLAEIRSKRRNQNIVLARHVAMYLSRQLTKMSLPEIANMFGGKDHTTVLYSCNKIEALLKTDMNLKNIVSELTTTLKQ